MRKRRRVATEKGRGGLTTSNADDLERQAVLDEALEKMEHEMDAPIAAKENESDSDDDDEEETEEAKSHYLDDDDRIMFEVTSPQSELRVVLKSHSNVDGDEANILLQDLQPSYIVLYDADVSFIRAIEIYSAKMAAADYS